MNRILYIFLFFCTVSHGQIIDRFTPFPSASTTEYFENRAGAANTDSSTSTSGWVGGSATVASSGTQTRTGTTSLLVTSGTDLTLQSRYFDWSSGLTNDLPDWTTNDVIVVEGWVYSPSDGDPRVYIPNCIGVSSITFTANTWTYFTFSGTFTGTGRLLYLYSNKSTGIYYDDIRVYKNN